MNKSELIKSIAVETDIPNAAAKRILDAFTRAINATLTSGECVSVKGFGSFSVRSRAGRVGRNPQTGASIQISAANTVHFKPGKTLKTVINSHSS